VFKVLFEREMFFLCRVMAMIASNTTMALNSATKIMTAHDVESNRSGFSVLDGFGVDEVVLEGVVFGGCDDVGELSLIVIVCMLLQPLVWPVKVLIWYGPPGSPYHSRVSV
jgi:hypothetical protein